MSGVALHTIATAATTLIANIVERRGSGISDGVKPMESQLLCLKQCMRALGQLEKSYFVTRRVRKIIQLVIRLLNLDMGQKLTLPFVSPPSMPSVPEIGMQREMEPVPIVPPSAGTSDDASSLAMEMWDCPESTSPFMVEDFLFPAPTQFDFLSSYEPCYGKI